jgi:tetratricopeptide (TPR) repeat protein
MKRRVFLIAILTYSLKSYCCLNPYEDIIGHNFAKTSPDKLIDKPYHNEGELRHYISEFYPIPEKNKRKQIINVAIAYVYLGKYKEALELSKELIRDYPKEYNIVITHAVCLELNGNLRDALTYMQKAVNMNPESHRGSEWIHIKILEHLIAKKPQNASVLELDFGNDSIPNLSNSTPELDIDAYVVQLEFQLEDRGYFVDTTNILYGSLMFDFANLVYASGNKVKSLESFKECRRYGFRHPALEKRIQYIENNAVKLEQQRQEQIEKEYLIREKKRIDEFNQEYEKQNGEWFVKTFGNKNAIFTYIGLLVIIISVGGFTYQLVRKRG